MLLQNYFNCFCSALIYKKSEPNSFAESIVPVGFSALFIISFNHFLNHWQQKFSQQSIHQLSPAQSTAVYMASFKIEKTIKL